jgi:Fic/DOC family N-terminal
MLVNTLPLLEARASSEIENIVTTNDWLIRDRGDEGRADLATKDSSLTAAPCLKASALWASMRW